MSAILISSELKAAAEKSQNRQQNALIAAQQLRAIKDRLDESDYRGAEKAAHALSALVSARLASPENERVENPMAVVADLMELLKNPRLEQSEVMTFALAQALHFYLDLMILDNYGRSEDHVLKIRETTKQECQEVLKSQIELWKHNADAWSIRYELACCLENMKTLDDTHTLWSDVKGILVCTMSQDIGGLLGLASGLYERINKSWQVDVLLIRRLTPLAQQSPQVLGMLQTMLGRLRKTDHYPILYAGQEALYNVLVHGQESVRSELTAQIFGLNQTKEAERAALTFHYFAGVHAESERSAIYQYSRITRSYRDEFRYRFIQALRDLSLNADNIVTKECQQHAHYLLSYLPAKEPSKHALRWIQESLKKVRFELYTRPEQANLLLKAEEKGFAKAQEEISKQKRQLAEKAVQLESEKQQIANELSQLLVTKGEMEEAEEKDIQAKVQELETREKAISAQKAELQASDQQLRERESYVSKQQQNLAAEEKRSAEIQGVLGDTTVAKEALLVIRAEFQSFTKSGSLKDQLILFEKAIEKINHISVKGHKGNLNVGERATADISVAFIRSETPEDILTRLQRLADEMQKKAEASAEKVRDDAIRIAGLVKQSSLEVAETAADKKEVNSCYSEALDQAKKQCEACVKEATENCKKAKQKAQEQYDAEKVGKKKVEVPLGVEASVKGKDSRKVLSEPQADLNPASSASLAPVVASASLKAKEAKEGQQELRKGPVINKAEKCIEFTFQSREQRAAYLKSLRQAFKDQGVKEGDDDDRYQVHSDQESDFIVRVEAEQSILNKVEPFLNDKPIAEAEDERTIKLIFKSREQKKDYIAGLKQRLKSRGIKEGEDDDRYQMVRDDESELIVRIEASQAVLDTIKPLLLVSVQESSKKNQNLHLSILSD